ncbi:hypothetical protein NBRC116593_43100 [Sulfitobacter pacificus]
MTAGWVHLSVITAIPMFHVIIAVPLTIVSAILLATEGLLAMTSDLFVRCLSLFSKGGAMGWS